MFTLMLCRRAAGALAIVLSLATTACTADSSSRAASAADSQAAHIRDVVAAGGVVDSILPVAEALRRFRADVPRVDSLAHTSASRDELVQRLARALVTQDTTDLRAMVLSGAEFAWLFYESSPLARAPYEAPPGLLWGQIVTSSDEGARQLLNRFGGKAVTATGLTCPNAPEVEGENRLYKRCTVRLTAPGAQPLEGNLFGTILERNGRFKFVGLGNRI